MAKRVGMEVSIAASHAVMLADVDAIAAYPITPQTHIVEHLSELVADGELDAEFIPVESEHSAMSVCAGTSAAGARTFTATSSQGLALMQEILYIVSAMRLPIVMTVVNRTLSAPLGIWNDHGDIMGCRDIGWIQIFTENGQEVFDNIICSFRVAEDKRVLLPMIVNLDGFCLSHVVEPIEIMDSNDLNGFLPVYEPVWRMHPEQPITMGAFSMPEIYTETKMAHQVVLTKSREVLDEVWADWAKLTGRQYAAVEKYHSEGAEVVFLGQGSVCELASEVVDQLRAKGESVGLVKQRLWRPYPFEDMRAALQDAKIVIVLDRALSTGGSGGPLAAETAKVLYDLDRRPEIVNYIVGLGGRDMPPELLWEIYDEARQVVQKGDKQEFYLMGVRE